MENLRARLASHNRGSGAFLMSPPDCGNIAHWILQSWIVVPARTIISGFARCVFVHLRSVVEGETDVDDTTDLVKQFQSFGLLGSQVGDVSIFPDVADSAIGMDR